jgi:hypothetical protein
VNAAQWTVAVSNQLCLADVVGYCGNTSPTTTVIACDNERRFNEGDSKASIMFPVRKGQYFKVVGTNGVFTRI